MHKSMGISIISRTLFGNQFKLVLFWIPLILISKLIRYTILKETLVDPSGGWFILDYIQHSTASFGLSSLSGDDTISPADNAIALFQILYQFGLDTYYLYEFFLTIIGNLLLFFLVIRCKTKYTCIQGIFLILSIMTLNIFSFNLAKEPVQFLYFVLLFTLFTKQYRSRTKLFILSMLLILFTALSFRMYYILIIYFSSIIYITSGLFNRINKTTLRIIILFVALTVAYMTLLVILEQINPSASLEIVRVRFRESDAVTTIQMFFQSQDVSLYSIDYFLLFFRLLFPVELGVFGIKYIVFAFVQLFFSVVYVSALKEWKSLDINRKISTIIFSGFLAMSAAFEPDFGSWIRHESVTVPLFLIMAGLLPVDNLSEKK